VSKGTLTLYTVISIRNAAVMDTATGVGCVVLQMKVQHNASDVIGEPIYMKKWVAGVSSSVGESVEKKLRLHDAKSAFMEHLQTAPINETCQTSDKSISVCENCSNLPCDWTEHGPGILQYLSN
jgi:hypothetical protein